MGGGTTRVGDPSGKDESRRILTDEMIEQNLTGIRAIFSKFLKFEGAGGNAVMANNADWLNKLNYIDFLRDVGKHFSVNRMLSFDSVKLRLDRQQELSFLEFNYMVLQAYDFVELFKREKCILQMGGSDQWGNIVSGIDLGRRMMNAQLFALTAPLITTSSGAKMGKTAAGAVWLNADMVSPYDYWQYWRNTEDGDVARFLKLFTDLPLTVEGEQQAVEARKVLDQVDFDLVLTSPLRRARRTAELAGFPDAQHEPLAVEWNYGDYEGISSDLIRKDNPDYLIWTHGVPNGETLDEVAARADKIVARVLESGLDNVLIVAHGHFSRILTARWLELPPAEGRHFILGTAKVCTLGWDKKTPAIVRWGL
jgi:broad specificity phosphatase PhoE